MATVQQIPLGPLPKINLVHLNISSVFPLIEFHPLKSPQYEARLAA